MTNHAPAICALLLLAACGDATGPGTTLPPATIELAGQGTAVIDGRIDAAEWATASRTPVFTDPDLVGSELLVMKDGESLYLGLRVPRRSLAFNDRVDFRVDNTLDSVLTIGDDLFALTGSGTLSDEWFNGTSFIPDRDAVVGEGMVMLVGTEVHWEFRRPLNGGTDDLTVATGGRFGLCVTLALAGKISGPTIAPTGCNLKSQGQRLYFDVHLLAR